MSFFSNPFAIDSHDNNTVPLFLAPSSGSPSSSISSKRKTSLVSLVSGRRSSSSGIALSLDIGPLDGPGIASTSSSISSNHSSINNSNHLIFNSGSEIGSIDSNNSNSIGSSSRNNSIVTGISGIGSLFSNSIVSSPPRQSRKASYTSSPGSRSNSRDSRADSSTPTPGPPRRVSLHSAPAPPLYSPTSSFVSSPFFVQNPPQQLSHSLNTTSPINSNNLNNSSNNNNNDPFSQTLDFSRRRSVDVGVLGHGSHQQVGNGGRSKRMREAVGPDAGDKETGFTGSTLKGGKDRLYVQFLSIYIHERSIRNRWR